MLVSRVESIKANLIHLAVYKDIQCGFAARKREWLPAKRVANKVQHAAIKPGRTGIFNRDDSATTSGPIMHITKTAFPSPLYSAENFEAAFTVKCPSKTDRMPQRKPLNRYLVEKGVTVEG
tara:strand:- start:267 stop:629 length:363 start_codon:yes stop_codon:yes gene_type:complete